MIKIIKKGTRQTKECSDCGCIFSFQEEDTSTGILYIEKNIDYNSVHFHKKRVIRCPQCGTVLNLES